MTNNQHGQVPAIQRYKIGYHSDEWGVRSLSPVGIYDDAGPWVRYEDHAAVITALRAQQPAPATQQAGGNSGFDYKTAADFLSGKTVSDEAMRKFVAASRGAHDDRAALRAQMLSLRGELASCEAEIALLKRSLLDAEAAAPQPSPTAQADSVTAPAGATSNTHWNQAPCVHCGCAEGQHFNARCHHIQGETRYTPTPQADSQPAPQGDTNAQLDTDSNSSAPGQQRDVAGTVALGQPVGHGSDSTAGDPSAQGDKLLTVAERNIRSFLRSATFKSESDLEAALNCVDVLWDAARAPADSGAAPAGGEIDRLRAALVYVAFALHGTPQHMLAEGITLIDGDTVRVSRDGWTVEASVNPARATPPAQAADSVLEDAARATLFTTPYQRGEMAGDGKPCNNDHDPDCRWPSCLCRDRAALAQKDGQHG